MTIFSNYAQFYDLFYADKDYAAETAYVARLLKRYHPGTRSVLDLGCGTGRHAFLLAERGFDVTGVDFSHEMLAAATAQLTGLADLAKDRLSFYHGDIRKVRLEQTFDAVIALFHVMSYQAFNDDLQRAFDTAGRHLNSEGVFIFDCWYGPGVLSDPPQTRVGRFDNQSVSVTRIAEPSVNEYENQVDVNYQLFVRDRATGSVQEIQERHRMRYLFAPEVKLMLANAGFHFLACHEFLKESMPGPGQWNVCFVARKADRQTPVTTPEAS
jgi:SAM-dependent methyltransferase